MPFSLHKDYFIAFLHCYCVPSTSFFKGINHYFFLKTRILAIIAIYENSKFTPIFDAFTNTVTTGTQYESQFAASIENRLLTINATETNYIRNLYLFNVSLIQQGDHIANQGTTKSNELNSNKIYA